MLFGVSGLLLLLLYMLYAIYSTLVKTWQYIWRAWAGDLGDLTYMGSRNGGERALYRLLGSHSR